MSLSAIARLKEHRERSAWFGAIVKVTIESFASQKAALAAEKKAIQNENPLYNIRRFSEPQQKTQVVIFRLPLDLMRWIDAESLRQNRTRANLIVHLLREAESAAAKPKR